MRRILSPQWLAAAALMLLAACGPSEPVARPPSLPIEMSSGVTPSPMMVSPAPPTVTSTPEMVVSPSVTPVSGSGSGQALPRFYRIQQREKEVVVVAFDPARNEEQQIATIPFMMRTNTYVYGSVLPALDQSKLAVLVSSSEAQRVYLINNGETRLIMSGEGEYRIGAWSPDGSRFLMFSTQGSDRGCVQNTCYFDLYLIDAATGAATRLTATEDAEVDAVWSPDGKQIAFLRGCVDSGIDECGPDLYLVSADGGSERLLAEGWIAAPVFLSPDQLAYIQYSGGSAGVYRISAIGGAPQVIISNPATTIAGMRGSPDGRMIAFIDVRGVCQVEACVKTLTLVAADGSGLRPIRTLGSPPWYYTWDWTADGRLWLLLPIGGSQSQSRLVLYAADGTLIDERVINWQP